MGIHNFESLCFETLISDFLNFYSLLHCRWSTRFWWITKNTMLTYLSTTCVQVLLIHHKNWWLHLQMVKCVFFNDVWLKPILKHHLWWPVGVSQKPGRRRCRLRQVTERCHFQIFRKTDFTQSSESQNKPLVFLFWEFGSSNLRDKSLCFAIEMPNPNNVGISI